MMRKYFSNQNMVILAVAIFTTTALHTMEERVSDSSETGPFVTIMLLVCLVSRRWKIIPEQTTYTGRYQK